MDIRIVNVEVNIGEKKKKDGYTTGQQYVLT